jgi:hypothetical protein
MDLSETLAVHESHCRFNYAYLLIACGTNCYAISRLSCIAIR